MAQTRAFAHIMKDFIGSKRLPMVIIDSKSVVKDPQTFSARAAGILGFSNFGYDHLYVLNDNMELGYRGTAGACRETSWRAGFLLRFHLRDLAALL